MKMSTEHMAKKNSFVGTRSFFLPLQNEGEWKGEGGQCLEAKSKE